MQTWKFGFLVWNFKYDILHKHRSKIYSNNWGKSYAILRLSTSLCNFLAEKTYEKHIISESVVFHRHHKTSLEELLKCWKGLKHVHTCRKVISCWHRCVKPETFQKAEQWLHDSSSSSSSWRHERLTRPPWTTRSTRLVSSLFQTHLEFSHQTLFTHKQPIISQSLCIINGNMTLLDNLSAFGGHTALLCHAGFTGLVCPCLVCALVSQYSEVFPVPDQPEGSLSFHHTSFGCTEICRWILLACVLNKLVKVPFCPWYHKRERKLN